MSSSDPWNAHYFWCLNEQPIQLFFLICIMTTWFWEEREGVWGREQLSEGARIHFGSEGGSEWLEGSKDGWLVTERKDFWIFKIRSNFDCHHYIVIMVRSPISSLDCHPTLQLTLTQSFTLWSIQKIRVREQWDPFPSLLVKTTFHNLHQGENQF